MIFILPGTGRWRAQRDGGGSPSSPMLPAPHVLRIPSTILRMVPLPASGEEKGSDVRLRVFAVRAVFGHARLRVRIIILGEARRVAFEHVLRNVDAL